MRVPFFAKHRELPRSFHLWMIVGLVALQLVTVGGILASYRYTSEQSLVEHMRSTLGGEAERSVTRTLGFLEPAVRSVEFTHSALRDGIDTSDVDSLERLFLDQLTANAEFDGIYFGGEDGSFVFVNRDTSKPGATFRTKIIGFDPQGARTTSLAWRDSDYRMLVAEEDPEDVYDPRVRPWYIAAESTEIPTWTDPYVFFSSQQPGITVSQAVEPTTGIGGAVGVDINLVALSGFLTSLDVGIHGGAFIIDDSGLLLAFPDADLVVDTKSQGDRADLASVEDPAARAAYSTFVSEGLDHDPDRPWAAEYETNGDPQQALFLPFTIDGVNTWVIGVYAPEDDFLGGFRATERSNVSIAIVISAIVAAAGLWVARKAAVPVVEMHGRAHTDQLTGLDNRRRLFVVAKRMITAALSDQRPLAIATIDADHFKYINDTYGHGIGDEVLVALAGRFRTAMRDRDVLARYGGEEFVAVLPDTDVESAHDVIDRLRAKVEATPINTSAGDVPVTISAGVAALSEARPHLDALLRESDVALYEAKRLGRNRVVVASDAAPVLKVVTHRAF